MDITAIEVEEKMKQNETLHIIDVREVDEVRDGKIVGAINIPLGLLEARMHELDKAKEYIVVCQVGGRSAQAKSFLEEWGYNVKNLCDGMRAWQGQTE